MEKNWQVMRNCCTSGNCIDCIGKTRPGVPVRIMQADFLTKDQAEKIAANWSSYKAVAEPMAGAK